MSLRWNSIKLTLFLTRVCSIIVWKLQRKGVEGCNLSKITKFIFIALHLMKLPKLPKSVIPPGPSNSCLSVLVRLYNICGYKNNFNQSFVRAFRIRSLGGSLTRSWFSVSKSTFKKAVQIKCLSYTTKTLFRHILT